MPKDNQIPEVRLVEQAFQSFVRWWGKACRDRKPTVEKARDYVLAFVTARLAATKETPTPEAEGALICTLRDQSCLLELLEDPVVARRIAEIAGWTRPEDPKAAGKRKQDQLPPWADQARAGITAWMSKVDDEPRQRLELILRLAEETNGWPSRELVEEMLKWSDFSEAEVRRWLSRLDSEGIIHTAARPTAPRQEMDQPPKRPQRRRAPLPREEQPDRSDKPPQPRHQPPPPPNHVGTLLSKEQRLKVAGRGLLAKWEGRPKGLGPATMEKLRKFGVFSLGHLAARDPNGTDEATKTLVSAIGRRRLEGLVAAAKAAIEETANGGA